MKKLILLFTLVTCISKGQSDDENHRKYWYYRTRLVNDFVKVGIDRGNSFPFNQRGTDPHGNGYNADINNHGYSYLYDGDGTSTLGYYIAVLATEWKLLKNNGQDLTKINHELYCALNAFNRADYLAETFYGQSGNLNGFFIRDDIPANMVSNDFSHFNYYVKYNSAGTIDNTSTRGFCSNIPNGMNNCISAGGAVSPDKPDIESQDQVYCMLLGLGLTATLVDGTANDGNNFSNSSNNYTGDGTTSLRDEARLIYKRILNYVKNSNGMAGSLPPYYHTWNLFRPDGTRVTLNHGGDFSFYSYPLSQAGCFVESGTELPGFTSEANPHACSTTDPNSFTDGVSYNLAPGYSIFHIIDSQGQGGYDDDLESYYQNLGAVCNCYYTPVGLATISPALYDGLEAALGLLTDLVNSIICYWGCPAWIQTAIDSLIGELAMTFNLNDTGLELYQNESSLPIVAHTQGVYDMTSAHPANGTKMYHGCYAHAIMHGNSWAYNLNSTMKGLLDEAPSCGIYNYSNVGWAENSAEWTSDNRLDHTNRIGYVAGEPNGPPIGGEFNGIDYMLYHNLYYLFNRSYAGVDLSDRIINFSFPVSQEYNTVGYSLLPYSTNITNNGSHSQPTTVGAFETIQASNTITSNADVTYRAGKTIHFIPAVVNGVPQQFHVDNGGDFHAYVEPFTCNSTSSTNSTGDYSRTANNDTSKSNHNSQNILYPSSSMFEQPTHITSEGPIAWAPPTPKSYNADIDALTNKTKSKLDAINTLINSRSKPINNISTLTTVDVFPNPSLGRITLQNTSANYTYTIMDVLGSIILIGVVNNNTAEVDLSSYQKGVYFISFDNGSGNKQIKKVILD